MADDVLDLIRQFGHAAAQATTEVNAENVQRAETLFARIAELLPQQPVQARDTDGDPLWIHKCGTVEVSIEGMRPSAHACSNCGADKSGPWRPLLVAAPAPIATDEPKCCEGVVVHNVHADNCPNAGRRNVAMGGRVSAMREQRMQELAAAETTLRQVMEALAVDRPEDVLPDVLKLKAAFERVCESADLRARQRDEARAQIEAQAGAFLAATNKLIAEREDWKQRYGRQTSAGLELCGQRDEARAEVERLKTALGHLNSAITWDTTCLGCADKLDGLIAQRAAGYEEGLRDASRQQQPDPLVLRLPEVPEGTVALIGGQSGRRWTAHESGGWQSDLDGGAPWKLSAVLDREWQKGVRPELAPPPAPEPRTWPKLDGAPPDLTCVHGFSGIRYTRWTTNGVPEWRQDRAIRGLSFSDLRELDGPLTEVLDEPGGAA